MKIIIHVLGLVAACMAGVMESSDSQDQEDSKGWQPSNNVPALDFSNHAGAANFLSGLGHNYQTLSHGNEGIGGPTFDHDVPQSVQSFGHDSSQGYDLSNHGQAKSFDLGSYSGPSSYAPSGHSYGSDSYVKAAHDFGNHDQGIYNSHAGNFGSQGGNDHGDTSSYGGDGYSVKSNEQGDDSYSHTGGAGVNSHTQAFILHDGGNEYGHGGQDATVHDLGVQGYAGHGGQYGHSFGGGLGHAEPFAVGEHTDEEHPVEVPLYKHVTVPVQKLVQVNVPKPILVGIPQPYPVKVPVNKPVAVPVETEISIPVEKVVPYPVVKHVPYPVEKHVPYKVEKTVHVHVPQPYPVKIPIYKTIHHHKHH